MSSTLSIKPQVVYVCHAFSGGAGPSANIETVRSIARSIASFGDTPIAPHLYLPQMYDDDSEREAAMTMCLRLIDLCDIVQVHGQYITDGMLSELAYASRSGKKITQFGSAQIRTLAKI